MGRTQEKLIPWANTAKISAYAAFSGENGRLLVELGIAASSSSGSDTTDKLSRLAWGRSVTSIGGSVGRMADRRRALPAAIKPIWGIVSI